MVSFRRNADRGCARSGELQVLVKQKSPRKYDVYNFRKWDSTLTHILEDPYGQYLGTDCRCFNNLSTLIVFVPRLLSSGLYHQQMLLFKLYQRFYFSEILKIRKNKVKMAVPICYIRI